MNGDLEENLREAACVGDVEAILALTAKNVNVNSQNGLNGWTALHWACKRGHEDIVRLLLNNGADPSIVNNKGETALNVCSNAELVNLLGGDTNVANHENNVSSSMDETIKFIPSYLRNPPLNGHVDIGPRLRTTRSDFAAMPTTALPATTQSDELILKVRIAGSNDPDFIEIEIPQWKLTYSNLLHICCVELGVKEDTVERIRKLPDTRLRKDSDVKRLNQMQSLEVVLKTPNNDKLSNCYQSISTCKDQTILY